MRRLPGGAVQIGAGAGAPHVVQGHEVVSELHAVGGGYALECQYTPERAEAVRKACRDAVASVVRR